MSENQGWRITRQIRIVKGFLIGYSIGMKKLIVGNWKMYGDAAMARQFTKVLAEDATALAETAELVICPPAVLIPQVVSELAGSGAKAGAQNCHFAEEGAYTGDVSARMLKNSGCAYVIVGHSERRKFYNERDSDIRLKAQAAINVGLIPIICVGETEQERASGKAGVIVEQQVTACLPKEAVFGNFVLAYEPVWAIGSGKVPSSDDIHEMHALITSVVQTKTGLNPEQVSVLYGGSVKPENSREILAISGVSGALVGGASLKAEFFCAIAASA